MLTIKIVQKGELRFHIDDCMVIVERKCEEGFGWQMVGGWFKGFSLFCIALGVFFEDMNHKNLVFNSKMKYRFDVDYGSTEFVASIIIVNSIQIKT